MALLSEDGFYASARDTCYSADQRLQLRSVLIALILSLCSLPPPVGILHLLVEWLLFAHENIFSLHLGEIVRPVYSILLDRLQLPPTVDRIGMRDCDYENENNNDSFLLHSELRFVINIT